MDAIDVSVKWPFKWCLVGSSGSGKTMFSLELIKNAKRIIDNVPTKLVIIYKEFQNIYDEFKNYFPTEILHEDEADIENITKNNKERLLLICDDLYFSKKLDDIAEQFLVKGRHRNTSWLVLTQSIFNRPPLINISRNSNHITLFKTVRLNEPHIFFSQLRPKSSKVLQNIFAKATESSYSYLDIDLSQTCPDKYRYKSKLFDRFVQIFLIMGENTFRKMYLVSESDLKENTDDSLKSDHVKDDNFKLSLENKDICDSGVNISVKPIKKKNTTNYKGGDEKTNQVIDSSFINGRSGVNMDDNKKDTHTKKMIETDDLSTEQLAEQSTEQPAIANDGGKNESNDGENSDLNEQQFSNLKRKPISLQNESYFQLKKAKRFAPYAFLKRNEKKSLLDEVDNDVNYDNADLPSHELQKEEMAPKDDLESSVSDSSNAINSDPMKDQWVNGIKSKINDRKVQFKRKQDSIGYRIAPEDIKNSLIKPNDFSFLSPKDSETFIDKWKFPDKMQQQKIRTNFRENIKRDTNKRFRLY